MSLLPSNKRGRKSAETQAKYDKKLQEFYSLILEFQSRLDFKASARGWCYILENEGYITKGDFDKAQNLIVDARKDGYLPIDFCAEDGARAFSNPEVMLDDRTPESEARGIIESVKYQHLHYTPFSFWEYQDCYIQLVVEKIDLKSLFERQANEYMIPLANSKGWSDIGMRADMIDRFKEWERKGKQCVLLYCGDHDPAGLVISDSWRKNINDLERVTKWRADNLIIDRFGLNYDFIHANNISWVENLETGSGGDLADEGHNDHTKPYVQNYIRQYGIRKCEANALVTRPEAGRALFQSTLDKYLSADGIRQYESDLAEKREAVRLAVSAGMSALTA